MRSTKEEVYMKSKLKWYMLAKDDRGGEICEVGTGSGECGATVQAKVWFCWVVGGYEDVQNGCV